MNILTNFVAQGFTLAYHRVAFGKSSGPSQRCGPASLRQISSPSSSGFTLVELIVVVTTVAVLACVLMLPVLAGSEPDVRKILCLNSKRQLCTAWRLYADDNGDKLVTNLSGGAARGGAGHPTYGKSWAAGWLDWTTSSDNTNVAFLIDPRYAKLAQYVNGATNLFRCPADTYLHPSQSSRGWSQRVRSVSANTALGEGNAEEGPWNPFYRHIRKFSELLYPRPAETWVFLDDHPDSMNDPAFFNPNQSAWIDLPANYHSGGAAFAFADCHAEIHKWTGSLSRVALFYGSDSVAISVTAGDSDIHWMSYHAPRISEASY